MLVLVLSLAALGLIASRLVSGDRIDGYQVGAQRCDRGDEMGTDVHGHRWCDTFTKFGRQTLDAEAPGHPEVVSVAAYNRTDVIPIRSGGTNLVVALHLADQSVRAFYIGCGVGLDNDRCFLVPPE